MKKQLLTLCAAIVVGSAAAQTPSPSFTINQDAVYPNPSTVQFPGVKFLDAVDANVVWTVGNDLAAPNRNYNWYSKSVNGGALFQGGNIFSDTSTYQIANMEGIDANTAWVSSFMKATSSKGAIHRTTNGGANWVNMTAPGMYTNAAAFTNIVSFFTPSIGITQGDPVNGEFEIWRTTDGGNSWNMVPGANLPNPLSGEFAIVNLYYKHGTNYLWFGTNAGRMYRTADAGVTWSVATVAPTTTLIEIAFSSPLHGITTAWNGTSLDLYNTNDGGQTWNFVGQPANFGFADIGGIPGTGLLISVGIGAGNEIVSISSDNGLTWVDLGSVGIPYTTVDFVDGTSGWLGSLDFSGSTQNFSNMWKYSAAPFSGTVVPTSAFVVSPQVCLSGSSASIIPVNQSVGGPAPTYSWSTTGGAALSSATASAPVITFPGANAYTITLVSTNSSGTSTVSHVVNVTPCTAPVASFSLPATICNNYTFTPTNSSTGSPAPTYSWVITPATQVTVTPSSVSSNPEFKVPNAGNYTLTLYTTNAAGSASTTQSFSAQSCPPSPNFTVPSTFLYCQGGLPSQTQFSTTNMSTNPPGGTFSYTWTIQPNTGITWSPNLFAPNLILSPQPTHASTYTITLRMRNASATASVTQIVNVDNCLFVGMEKNALEANLRVYPNPASDFVQLELPAADGGHTIKITNILGSVVHKEHTAKTDVQVNLNNHPKGVYFITVESKESKVTRKIVLE